MCLYNILIQTTVRNSGSSGATSIFYADTWEEHWHPALNTAKYTEEGLMTIPHQTIAQAEYPAKITEDDGNSHTEAASWRLDASSLNTVIWKLCFPALVYLIKLILMNTHVHSLLLARTASPGVQPTTLIRFNFCLIDCLARPSSSVQILISESPGVSLLLPPPPLLMRSSIFPVSNSAFIFIPKCVSLAQ